MAEPVDYALGAKEIIDDFGLNLSERDALRAIALALTAIAMVISEGVVIVDRPG